MNSELAHRLPRQQGGFIMVAVMVLVTVLLGTGIAFMRWQADEAIQSADAAAAMQAYYLGQMGIIEKGFVWLRTQPANMLPIGEYTLPGRLVQGYGRYSDVKVAFLAGETGGDFWAQQQGYRISSVGIVQLPALVDGRPTTKEVKRKAVLYVRVRSFADYMYLSDEEMTWFGDRIKFWNGDTLNGRVHSNSQIAIMQSPVFYDIVSTTEEDFWRGQGYAPRFLGPAPIFNAPEVLIPEVAQTLRDCASRQGNVFGEPTKVIRASFRGGMVQMFQWDVGTPIDSSDNWQVSLGGTGVCIFCFGPLEISGVVMGDVTIGSSHTIRILDNIRYDDANPNDGRTGLDSHNYLGIVSEAEVKVANTPANGRENGYNRNPSRRDSHSVVITGAVVALGESFTFENQNDPDSGYVCITPCNCTADGRGGGPDDRGTIYLFGSLTQMRRGYVHRSNCTSTGYLKQYRYDQRLLTHRPPGFFNVTDEEGHALFNIVQWGQGLPSPPEHNRGNIVRYN